ncbi:hypothetical protein H7X69_01205 [Candidatus Saccharibacteria bacterium]|nr:hypothetical protein [Candidatus Saccharibacteria bacterium]
MDIVYLLASQETEPKQKTAFEMAGSQIVNPDRILGRLAMTSEQENRFDVVELQFESSKHMVGQLAMELQLVIPESDQH